MGVQRSGTKLLRDLLNQNPNIGIPIAESNFIPKMIKRFGNLPPFQNDAKFQEFYEEYTQTTFFWWMKKFGYVMSKEYLEKEADRTSWSSIIEVILRYHVPHGRDKEFIWGDKSPDYMFHINALKDLYPEARFIHIIRDPRDNCLSKKKAWGRHLYRSAEIWRSGVENARYDGQQLGGDYMEVYYELLLENPEKTLRDICTFLGCKFTTSMMQPGRDCEDLGDAKGETKILKNNKKKYTTQLTKTEIRRIEEIVYPLMELMPYEFDYATMFNPISRIRLHILSKHDRWNRLMFNIRTKGFLEGIRFNFRLFKKHSS